MALVADIGKALLQIDIKEADRDSVIQMVLVSLSLWSQTPNFGFRGNSKATYIFV